MKQKVQEKNNKTEILYPAKLSLSMTMKDEGTGKFAIYNNSLK